MALAIRVVRRRFSNEVMLGETRITWGGLLLLVVDGRSPMRSFR